MELYTYFLGTISLIDTVELMAEEIWALTLILYAIQNLTNFYQKLYNTCFYSKFKFKKFNIASLTWMEHEFE